jgi:hypothetical protein
MRKESLDFKVATFIILTFGLSWGLYYIYQIDFNFLMFAPGIVAGVLTLTFKERTSQLIKISSAADMFLGIAISCMAFALVLLIAISLSLGSFGLPEDAIKLNNGSVINAWLRLLFLGVPYMLLINLIFAAGEEIGWRGYLLKKLQGRVNNFWLRSVIVGIIWGIWHLPMYFAANLLFENILVFFLNVCLISVVYTWLYERNNSVWAVSIAHATHNMLFNAILPILTLDRSEYTILWGEEGLLVTLSYALLLLLIICFVNVKYKKVK